MVILPMRTAKTNNHPKLNYKEKQTSIQILHWKQGKQDCKMVFNDTLHLAMAPKSCVHFKMSNICTNRSTSFGGMLHNAGDETSVGGSASFWSNYGSFREATTT